MLKPKLTDQERQFSSRELYCPPSDHPKSGTLLPSLPSHSQTPSTPMSFPPVQNFPLLRLVLRLMNSTNWSYLAVFSRESSTADLASHSFLASIQPTLLSEM